MFSRTPAANLPLRTRLAPGLLSILIAATLWIPCLHLVFRPQAEAFRSKGGVSPAARQLAQRHLELWTRGTGNTSDIAQMRVNNPEWDFMGRTFLVLSLANMCLREPDRQAGYLEIVDRIIDDTSEFATRQGINYFLLAYARASDFRQQPVRSIFVDGELALMMGARRLVSEQPEYAHRMRELVHIIADRMAAGPVLSCESYPDECWVFCNTLALAAVRMHEVLDGDDHAHLRRDWLARARERLVNSETGLLCSSYTYDGQVIQGPEGSTIWMAAHCLQVVDEEFAEDQYRRAKRELAHNRFGFGWAGEWTKAWVGSMDVDSGPVIPLLDVSAGSSGQAFVAAASFGDTAYYRSLATTLMFAGFPSRSRERMRFCASNQVGDAVILYSTVAGPLWEQLRERRGGMALR